MTTIIVTQEDGEIDEFGFGRDTRFIGLGRRATNEVCIPDRSVSATHARILFDAGSAWIEDLNSTNGTYINGRLISRQRLDDNDEIILGKIRVTFQRSAESPIADSGTPVPLDDGDEDGLSLSQRARQALDHGGGSNRARLQAAARRTANESQSDTRSDGGPDSRPDSRPNARQDSRPDSRPGSRARDDGPATSAPVSFADMPESDTAGASLHAAPIERVSPPSRPVAPHPLDGLENGIAKQPMHELDSDRAATSRGAVIEIKNGAKSGQILPIDKPVTTLGRPGIQIAAIMRKPDGYFLMHIESDDSIERPTLNRDSIGDEPVMLHSGDELNVAGIDVEFMLS